jgi:enoyl-CoA hydratase
MALLGTLTSLCMAYKRTLYASRINPQYFEFASGHISADTCSMADEILYRVEDCVAILTFNRPERRNALNWNSQEQFATIVNQISQNENIRVVIVTGAGNKAFASGGDLKELSSDMNPSDGERLNRIMGGALETLVRLRIPVIAAINGDAIGGGCEIATACDLRLAASNARFRFAQVQVGLTTGWGGTSRLVRLLGASRSSDLMLSARFFSVEEAYQMGFIHGIAPAGSNVLFEALNLASRIKELPGQALAATKSLIRAATYMPAADVNQIESQLFNELWLSADHLEALNAFKEKRDPQFRRNSTEKGLD